MVAQESRQTQEIVEMIPPYPNSTYFILVNQFCERCSFFGIKAILIIYLTNTLGYDDETSTTIYHVFSLFCFITPLLIAFLADSFLGMFRTILIASTFYIVGNSALFSVSLPLDLPSGTLILIGLALVSIGVGGRPVISAFGAEQFVLPVQEKQAFKYFSILYFFLNAGSLASKFLGPFLAQQFRCFGQPTCYPLSFGAVTAFKIFALLIFIAGKPWYKTRGANGNIISKVVKCIAHAWSQRRAQRREGTVQDSAAAALLDYAEYGSGGFTPEDVNEVKTLLRILPFFLPLPMFYALFDQQGSTWTLQAQRMDRNLFGWTIQPDAVQILNPLLAFILIPFFDWVVYPLGERCGILHTSAPLQRVVVGGVLAGAAFLVAGTVEAQLESRVEDKLHIFWIFPQYLLLTLGEVMFVISGRHFAFLEAPASMKSVIVAVLSLTVAFGNLIVVIITKLPINSKATLFYLYGGLMVVDMAILAALRKSYEKRNHD